MFRHVCATTSLDSHLGWAQEACMFSGRGAVHNFALHLVQAVKQEEVDTDTPETEGVQRSK